MDEKRRTIKDEVLDSGTGYTILKLSSPPVVRLVERKKIGPEALEAAQEIEKVFTAITCGLLMHPPSMEKQDRSYGARDPGWLIDAQARYKRWMDHWSAMATRGHRLLEIVIAALYDMRPCHVIDNNMKLRNGKAEKVLICGLQDYAARAGWVRGKLAQAWQKEAAGLFRLRDIDLTSGGKNACKSAV